MKRTILLLIGIMAIGMTNISAQQNYSLSDCRKMALSHNKKMLISNEKVNAAKYIKKAAFTQYLPNISATGAYVWTEKTVSILSDEQKDKLNNLGTNTQTQLTGAITQMAAVNPTVAQQIAQSIAPFTALGLSGQMNNLGSQIVDDFDTDTHNTFAGAILLTQPIFLGGKIREMNRIAKYNQNIVESEIKSDSTETIYDVDEAYWRVVSLVNKKKLAESYLKLLDKLDSDVEKSISFGVATKADGLTVKVKKNEAEMTLTKVLNGLQLSKMALCQICGLSLNSEYTLADENLKTELQLPDNNQVDMQKSINARHETYALQQALNIAESNRRLMISRFLPSVVAVAGYGVSNPNVYNGFENKFAGTWEVGVVAHVPIFHFGDKIYTYDAAKCERNIAQYKLEEVKEKIELDISQAQFKTNEACKKEIMAQKDKDKAEENLRYANISFDAGVIPSSTLMEAQTAWLKANSEAIDASIEVKMSEVNLKKVTGGIR